MWGLLAAAVAITSPDPVLVPMEETVEVDPAGHGCLERTRLVEQMRIWLERDTLDARIQIRVVAEPDRADRVHFWVDRAGERVVDRPFEPVPESCDAVHAALGLAIAFALDSTVLGELGVTPTAQQAAPVSPEASPRPAADEPVAEPASPPGTPVALRLQASTGLGIHPGVAFGGQLLTAIHLVPALEIRVGAGASAGLPVDLGSGRVRTTLMSGRFDLCGGGTVRTIDLRGCAGVLGGFMGIRGESFPRNADGLSGWVAIVGGAAMTIPAGRRVGFALDLDGIIPVLKPRIVVDDASTGEVSAVRKLPVAGGVLSLGVAVRLR